MGSGIRHVFAQPVEFSFLLSHIKFTKIVLTPFSRSVAVNVDEAVDGRAVDEAEVVARCLDLSLLHARSQHDLLL